jgi:hypothetical protein
MTTALEAPAESLPRLIEAAAAALATARTPAEILDAGYRANVVYTAAKVAARLAKAKQAHDEILTACHRTMGDALIIETQAQCRLADEYDAAQARGEAATHSAGNPRIVSQLDDLQQPATSSELGIKRQQLFEARIIRNAERATPGIVRRTVQAKLNEGQAPTRADVMRAARPPRPQPEQSVRFNPRPAPATSAPAPAPSHVEMDVADVYWHALGFVERLLERRETTEPGDVWTDARDLLACLWEFACETSDCFDRGELTVTGDPEALRKWNALKDEFEQMFPITDDE